jgi:AAA family ATP:ADP antiporter
VRELSRSERLLRIFTDVRPGEGPTALLMFANVFLILCAYYFVKPLRDGWIAVSAIEGLSKMEVKAYSSFAQSLLFLGAIAVYARLSATLPRARLIARSTLFCMSNLVLFWFLQPDFFVRNLPGTGIAFYLWVGMFGLFVVAQFWAFAADLYSDERGRRLLPMIAIGATSGATVGSFIVEQVVHNGLFDSPTLLLLANIPLALSIWLTRRADGRGPMGDGQEENGLEPPAPEASSNQGAFALIRAHRYLLLVAAVTLLNAWVNTNGENLLFRVVQEALADEFASAGVDRPEELQVAVREATTAFYGGFFFWVNLTALLLQSLVASRLLALGGVGAILLLLPSIALLGYTSMAFLPILGVVRIMKIAENATDYSINNTAAQVLWLPTTAEMKFKAKPAISTFYVRFGDGLAALTVLVGVHLLDLSTRSFFLLNSSLALLWLLIGWSVVREHGRLVAGGSDAERA